MPHWLLRRGVFRCIQMLRCIVHYNPARFAAIGALGSKLGSSCMGRAEEMAWGRIFNTNKGQTLPEDLASYTAYIYIYIAATFMTKPT